MLINSITLENFRQYKGTQSIKFSTNKEKNVTVIIGKNTCGKTTIVQSFIWCLYGKVTFDDKNLINMEVDNELMSGNIGYYKYVTVSIDLIHSNQNYIISRRQRHVLNDKRKKEIELTFTIYRKNELGALEPVENTGGDYDNIIYNILPENLSDYFFFWGERIENLSNKKNISKQVKDFLGLTTLDQARKHLKAAVAKLYKNKTDNNNQPIIDSCNQKIKRCEKAIEQAIYDKSQAEKNYEYYEHKYSEKLKELMNSNNRTIAVNQKKLQDNLTLLKEREKSIINERKKLKDRFNDNAVYYYSESLSKKAIQIIKDNPEPVIGWAHAYSKTIDEIIERGECLCGTKIEFGSEAYQHLLEVKKVVSPNVIGGVLKSFIDEVKVRNSYNVNYIDSFKDTYKSISRLENEIDDLNSAIHGLRKDLEGTIDMKKEQDELNNYQQERDKALGNISKNEQIIESNEQEIEKYRLIIKRKEIENDKNSKYLQYINYAEAVLDNINNDYEEKEKLIREKLQAYVKEYFNKMYAGERNVEIDSDFKVQTYNYINGTKKKAETSPGLETVKNFAFIAGLVQIAKDRIKTDDDSDDTLSSEPYPLVLDAPFSQADEIHVPAISSLISNIAEQIILVVMEKDWNYAKQSMLNKVGSFYELDKVSETYTVIKSKQGGENSDF